jgi:hypothetical protein
MAVTPTKGGPPKKGDTGPSAPTITSDIKYPPMLPPGQDLSSVVLYYSGNPEYEIRENIISARMDLTTEGSHKVTIQVADVNRKLLRSGYLGTHTDIKLYYTQHASWWRLAQVAKSGELLTLTFEDRHVQILKSFNKRLLVNKGTLNRCQFVWRLILEAQKLDPLLDFNGPCIGAPGSKQKVTDSLENITMHPNPYTPAVPYKPSFKFNVRIKGEKPTTAQLKNIDDILAVGAAKKVRRKLLVVAIMVAIGESSINNYPCVTKYGRCPDGPIGVFQQFHSYGWPASNNVREDAGAFFNAGIAADKEFPNITYQELGTKTQNSGWNFNLDPNTYLGNYTSYIAGNRNEAEKIVDAWGYSGEDISTHANAKTDSSGTIGANDQKDPFAIPPGWSASSGDSATQQWHRGAARNTTGRSNWTPENSWDCIERMANEVKWYKFMVWDDLWFRPSDDFFTAASADIEEFEPDIGYIDGDYDRNKKTGTITVNTFSDQWTWLPGQTLNMVKMGPWDGLWWVTEVQMDLIGKTDCQVTLKKPIPPLTEAQAEAKGKKSKQGLTGGELPGTKGGKGKQPIGAGFYDLGVVINGKDALCDQYITHQTANYPNHPAVDIMANAGTPVHAPQDLVIDFWGHATPGYSLAAYGPEGLHFWFGHLQDGGRPAPGAHVKKYDVIGYVIDQGGASHVHVGTDARAAAGFALKGGDHYNIVPSDGTICDQLNGKKT